MERSHQLRSIVVPGNHDGVHRGHRALLDRARQLGDAHSARVVAMFFDPHPVALFSPDRAPTPLTLPKRRAELLAKAGADEVWIQPFDRAFASLAPETFARTVLRERLAAAGVVIGPDFRFGKDRAGDFASLRAFGRDLGFVVEQLDPVLVDGQPVSSSRVRETLVRGEVDAAARLLGRVHEMEGVVVRGDGRGRTIGVPTANLRCEPLLAPKDGVYAIVGRDLGSPSENAILHGVANLGMRPTFEAGRSVEVHFFDLDRDLYGRTLRIGFVARLRDEIKFGSLDALKAQIAKDMKDAREALASMNEEAVAWM